MYILAIETTEKFGSAALLNDQHVLAEAMLPKDRRSSQTLHPTLQTLFEGAQLIPQDIDVVAVVTGPGSFTGLRVGVTAAKIFAYTVGAKIIALDTFRTVAAAIPIRYGVISVGVDAQRGEVVAAVLRTSANGHVEILCEPRLLAVDDWWKHAEQYDNVLFTGPALERWSGKVPPHVALAEEADWYPQASAVGRLAAERIAAQQFEDVGALLPVYSRPSAAEEKRNSQRSPP